ncbi:MAG: hypothetical protein K8T90_01105, partial [Planctomycetes bacterium]|nr:hypothetical protein [Planctomycetota bacterium]
PATTSRADQPADHDGTAALSGTKRPRFPEPTRPAAERFVVRIPESMTPRRWPEYKSPWPLVLCVGNPERRGGDVVLMPPLDVFEVIIDPGE